MPVQFYLFTRPDKQGDHPINVSISLFGERLCTSVGYAIAPDGSVGLPEGQINELLRKYWTVQYDLMFGKEYSRNILYS